MFPGELFPPQLKKVMTKFEWIREGLLLMILVVAHILYGLDKIEEYWNMVASNKTATFKDASDRISKVLFPIYEYLP